MQGDHDELEIFPKICLINFMNRSKVAFQRENTWLFKDKFSPIFEPFDAVMGSDRWRRGGILTLRCRGS